MEQTRRPAAGSEWVAVSDVARENLASHPWNLSGGATAALAEQISLGAKSLGEKTSTIGYTGQTNSDEAFLFPENALRRQRIELEFWRSFLMGDDVRDFQISPQISALFPYRDAELATLNPGFQIWRWMWPNRTTLWARATFGKSTYRDEGRTWWEWHQLAKSRLSGPVITWAFVQTHNHFSFLSNCLLHNRSAPLIKLDDQADEYEHLALLGLLNSSTACFWLKHVCHDKGSQSGTGGFMHDEWERFYEFAGTKLQAFPIPGALPTLLGRTLNAVAKQLAAQEPSSVGANTAPTRRVLEVAHREYERLRSQIIAIQEELDWEVYGSYGLLSEAEIAQLTIAEPASVPDVQLGERAFEIVLARKVKADEAETVWFVRHGSTPITEIPERWPESYRRVVQARIDVIEKRRDIALIERPECKRRWAAEPWEKKERAALRTWLLDRCERQDLWFRLRDGVRHPRTLTISQLADQFSGDADMRSVAELYANDHLGKRDLPLAKVLEEVLADEHVPYLAALRYKDSGLRKRAEWERVWEQQREEDRTGKRLDIEVPPKYASADFRKASYWSHRGKLDVPKERFISYPGASLYSDKDMLLGWAGWDHKDQAQALVNLVNDRAEDAGWDTDRLAALLAGLLELMPWVKQWHGEYDAEWEGVPAEEFQAFLDDRRGHHRLSEQDLRDWRPATTRRRAK